MCLPGVILEAGIHPQHFGLGAVIIPSPTLFCVILFCSHAFPFTIPYLMHIDLITCNLGTSFLFAVMLLPSVKVVGVTVVYFLYTSSLPQHPSRA